MGNCNDRLIKAELEARLQDERIIAVRANAACWTDLFGEPPPRAGSRRLWNSQVMVTFDPDIAGCTAEISVGKGAPRKQIEV